MKPSEILFITKIEFELATEPTSNILSLILVGNQTSQCNSSFLIVMQELQELFIIIITIIITAIVIIIVIIIIIIVIIIIIIAIIIVSFIHKKN